MRDEKKLKPRFFTLLKKAWWILLLWTIVLIAAITRDLSIRHNATENLAIREARAHIQRDAAFRFWAATHGGFYVPIDERTKPNPHMSHIADQNIETTGGVKLTLMNPAWAIRQMNEDYAKTNGVAGHITSLKPLREKNLPDTWEEAALVSFEKGEAQSLDFTQINNESFLRLMEPLITKKGCLKCHERQGYKVGDIRGGVSVSIPLTDYLKEEQQASKLLQLSYFIFWLFGFGSILYGTFLILRSILERENTQLLFQESHDKLEKRVQERTSELVKSNLKLESEISERLLAEEKILDSKNQLELIIDISPGLLAFIDKNEMTYPNLR